MSFQNFEKAMELAKGKKFYTTAGGRTEEEIKEAEKLLGIQFSGQYRVFNEKYGYVSFFGNEIFGIDPNDLDELEGNSVAYALNDREEYNLPDYMLPIYNYDDGCMAYLDYSVLNDDGEPRVIMAEYTGEEYEVVEVLAEDFGDFVLQLVQEQ